MTAVNQIDGILQSAAAGSLAVQRRRERRREEWREQMKLSVMLDKYLDPTGTFWTSLENKPISRISGIFQKKRGVRSGIPDVFVLYLGRPIFVELKSRVGVATKVQKQVRVELLPAGATWWMARSARAALMALHLSGVVFRRQWKPPRLKPWEGPFADPTRAAAASAGRGGAATGGTAAMAGASAARPRDLKRCARKRGLGKDL